MLDRYRAVLVAPYRERLRAFDPIRADAPPLPHDRARGHATNAARPDALRRAA